MVDLYELYDAVSNEVAEIEMMTTDGEVNPGKVKIKQKLLSEFLQKMEIEGNQTMIDMAFVKQHKKGLKEEITGHT